MVKLEEQKMKYEEPTLEELPLEKEDIITLSVGDGSDGDLKKNAVRENYW